MKSKKIRYWYSARFWVPLTIVGIVVGAYSSCGSGDEFNLFQPIAEPLAANDTKSQVEQAKVHMDNGEYEEASDILEEMSEDESTDSNEVRMLLASAKLGEAELDIWSIITKILDGSATSDSDSDSSESSSGLDSVLDSFGDTFLGTGATKTRRVASLNYALNTLRTAPYPNSREVSNTACLFAGLLAVPTLLEAKTAMDAVTTALSSISSAVSGDGSDCPDVDSLTEATSDLSAISTKFTAILASTGSCPFLDLGETEELMNSIESQLSTLTANVDKGCDVDAIECPAALPTCKNLFPTCVQEALDVEDSDAVADDGKIASCEIVLNCTDPTTCFGT